MLPLKKLKELKKELDDCRNPMFIFDKDTDGVCSYLLFYKYKGEGYGIPRLTKKLDSQILKKVDELKPDKIFLLDTATNFITEEFLEGINVPIIQVDHHLDDHPMKGIKIFNPRLFDKKDGSPTSTICYQVVKQNLWISAVGSIFDWCLGKEVKEFAKKNPDIIDPKIKKVEKARFDTKLGELCVIINFLLKGKTNEVKKNVRDLQDIKDPKELLEQNTALGKELHNRYMKMYKQYKALYEEAESKMTKDKFFFFKYNLAGDEGFSADLSTELHARHPDKVVFVCKEKDGDMRCSIRASFNIRDKLMKALEGIQGTGGGHEVAVGATIKNEDFDLFLERFKELVL